MKQILKLITTVLCMLLIIFSSVTAVFAHSGRTDGNGGHKDNKNKSGLGSYHYHCGGYPAHLHTQGYCPYRDVFPSSVTIKSDKTTLGIGEKIAVVASIYPSNSCNTNVNWSCSDPSVVSLSNGIITALKYGTATITVETFNGKKDTITITVKEITADKVSISGLPDVSNFYIGETFKLTATITPENVDNPAIKWASSNNEIATVSASGEVKLISEGKVEIIATASNGVSGKVAINVEEKYIESVEIAETEIEVYLGEKYTIQATITPSDATYPELTWVAENPEIISVSEDGVIAALSCGETILTATSRNNISDSVLIKVNEIKAESLKIEGNNTVLLGDSISLSAVFSPLNTSDQNINWSIDNTKVATISTEGILTAKNTGKVVVTATQKDVFATFTIEVVPPVKVEDIQITASTKGAIAKNETISFFAEVLPQNATYPDITWSVSDSSIATIDANGVLTALESGTVTVIATSADGFYAEYKLKVASPSGGIIGVCIVGTGAAIIGIVNKKKKQKQHAYDRTSHLNADMPSQNLSPQPAPSIAHKPRRFLKRVAILCLIGAGTMLLGSLSAEPYLFGGVLFYSIFGIMFLLLSKTPKCSIYLLGKDRGIKKGLFVLLCILGAFASLIIWVSMIPPASIA